MNEAFLLMLWVISLQIILPQIILGEIFYNDSQIEAQEIIWAVRVHLKPPVIKSAIILTET